MIVLTDLATELGHEPATVFCALVDMQERFMPNGCFEPGDPLGLELDDVTFQYASVTDEAAETLRYVYVLQGGRI